MKKNVLCIYHKLCLDGYLAASVVAEKFGRENVDFIALDYGDPVPDLVGRIVYIVDFSFRPDELLPAIERLNCDVTMIDHHEGAIKHWAAIEEKPFNLNFIKDVTKSGAMLTWEFFNPDKQPPLLLSIGQDYDLWKFEMHYTREIAAALYSYGFIQRKDIVTLSELSAKYDDLGKLMDHGSMVLNANRTVVGVILQRNCDIYRFMGYEVPVANIPHEFMSLAGDILSAEYPFALLYEDQLRKGIRKFSMRSNKKTDVNVNELAMRLGGAGHRNAAGFSIPLHADMGTYLKMERLRDFIDE